MPTRRRLQHSLAFSTLEKLPDLVHATIASFLDSSDLNAIASCSKALYDSTSLCPSFRRLVWRAEPMQATYGTRLWWAGRSSFASLLSRHGGAVHELELADAILIDLFCEALRLGGGGRVRSLTICTEWLELDGFFDAFKEDAGRLLATALESGSLPELETLRLRDAGETDWRPVLRALGMGSCPCLRVLDLGLCNKQLFQAMTEALTKGEQDGSCVYLRELRCNADFSEACEGLCDELGPLLACEQFRRLETLELSTYADDSFLTEAGVLAVECYLASNYHLKRLVLGCLDDYNGDGLAVALASGAAPELEIITIHNISFDTAAVRTLAEAVIRSGVLRHLLSLEITSDYDVQPGPTDLSDLMAAVAQSHGWPSLRTLKVTGVVHAGAAVSLALAGPQGLPALTCLGLELMEVEDLRRLAKALQQRQTDVCSLEQLSLVYSSSQSLISPSMGRLAAQALLDMLRSPSVVALRELDLVGCKLSGAAVKCLAEGVRSRHCCENLESLQLTATRVGVSTLPALLEAMATDGACPRLTALDLRSGGKASLTEVEPLAALLDGRRPAVLKELDVRLIRIDSSCVSFIARALSLGSSARLESLSLCLKFGGPGRTEALDLVEVLRGRAGDQLRQLWLKLEGLSRKRADGVGEMVADAIEGGAMPLLEDATVGRVCTETGLWEAISFVRIEKLLEQRRRAKSARRPA